MISLDGSIIAALVVFLATLVALNFLLFRPLLRVQAERERRTTGMTADSQNKLQESRALFERYAAAVKQARLDAYQRNEQLRAEAMSRRASALEGSRRKSEDLVAGSRESIRSQTAAAKELLEREAREIAGAIAAAVLQKPA